MAEFLADDERGCVRVEGNELITDSKIADAAAVRVGSPKQDGASSGGGKFSFDDTTVPGSRREIALLSVGDGVFGPEFKLQLLKKDGGSNDADMVNPMRATATEVEFTVPITAPNLGPPVAATVTRMWAPNGMSFTQQQDDGNFVTYTTTVSFSIAPEHVTAVWSAWDGKLT